MVKSKQFNNTSDFNIPNQFPHSLLIIGINISDNKIPENNKPFRKYINLLFFLSIVFIPSRIHGSLNPQRISNHFGIAMTNKKNVKMVPKREILFFSNPINKKGFAINQPNK